MMLNVNGGNWTTQLKGFSSQEEGFWLNDSCHSFEFFLCSVVIGSICLIGLIGNTVSFIVLGSDKQNLVATFLLRALAVVDCLLLIVSVLILSAILGPYQIPSTRPTLRMIIPYMKKYINPFGLIAQSCTIWVTVLLAINRYIAVCKPFAAKHLLTLRKAQLQVVLIVVMAVGFNIPRFFQYDVVYRLENNVTVPRKQLTALGNNVSFDIGYFNVFYNIVILVLPLVALVVFNTKIIWDMHISKNNMQRNSLNYAGLQERNITIVMLIIILKLILFHSPDRIVSAIKIVEVHRNPFLACPHPVIYASHFSNLLIILNSSTDFFIYCIFRERFRRMFRIRFCFCRSEGSYSPSRRKSSILERIPSYSSAKNQPPAIRLLFCREKRRHSSNNNDKRLLSTCSSGSGSNSFCPSRRVSRQESVPSRNGDAKHSAHITSSYEPVTSQPYAPMTSLPELMTPP